MIIYIYVYRDVIHQSGFNYVQIIAFMCLVVSGSICIYVYIHICVCVRVLRDQQKNIDQFVFFYYYSLTQSIYNICETHIIDRYITNIVLLI